MEKRAVRTPELISAELKLAEAYAQMAQMSGALASYQFREAQANAQRLAAELREVGEAASEEKAEPPVNYAECGGE